ncbi:MAG: Asp-tRNA(Asn)/Glu-tRNA(Gln) amidotransferase subunit GatA, partial [Deltaproteobacteria bacterium]|nr:Asp-tRNA(Asn)/Glu-tRNA(Gln) amidotransferase subunit GatA [Deltaproteobacteria bacterium]
VRDRLAKGDVSAAEVTRSCLAQIERTEPRLNALLCRRDEAALEEAQNLDRRGPDASRPLWGVPFTLKDSLLTQEMPTTAGSRMLENYLSCYDAFVVKRLREAGAIMLGKTNMDEFAMGSSTEFSAFGPSKNPWDVARVPGGSSGGSAVSVAACQCFASLAADTGGSIRQPAAFCGCVGLKPTYGRVSRYGGISLGSSLDQIGPMTRSVEDCALVLSVIAGHDPRDATSSPLPADDYLAALKAEKGLKGLRLGLPREFTAQGLSEEMEQACREALDLAARLGAEIVSISLPLTHLATAVYYIILMAEASSNMARFDGAHFGRRAEGAKDLEELYARSRSEGFGEEVKRRIMLGTYVLSSGYYDAYYKKAAQARRLIRRDFEAAFKQCDMICGPVAPLTAWPLGEADQDPLTMYLRDLYTLPANLAGLPALSLPLRLGSQSRMPTALQLIGRPFDEATLLGAAHALESALPRMGLPPAAV